MKALKVRVKLKNPIVVCAKPIDLSYFVVPNDRHYFRVASVLFNWSKQKECNTIVGSL